MEQIRLTEYYLLFITTLSTQKYISVTLVDNLGLLLFPFIDPVD